MIKKTDAFTPAAAFEMLERTRRNVPDMLMFSTDPQSMLVGMDHLGQGALWRSEVPRILQATLAAAGHGEHWHDGSNYQMKDQVVRAVMDPWALSTQGRNVPPRDASHLEPLLSKYPHLVGQVYEASANLQSIGGVVATWHLLSQYNKPAYIKAVAAQRDVHTINSAIATADTPDLAHHIIKAESLIDRAKLEENAPSLMRLSQHLNARANIAEHLAPAIAQRDPALWQHVVVDAKALALRDDVKLAVHQAENGGSAAVVTPEARFVRAVQTANRSLGRGQPFALHG